MLGVEALGLLRLYSFTYAFKNEARLDELLLYSLGVRRRILDFSLGWWFSWFPSLGLWSLAFESSTELLERRAPSVVGLDFAD